MHSKPMSESDGTFRSDETPSKFACPQCGRPDSVTFRIWESHCGGFEDAKYTCQECGHSWWVDGPDS